MMTVTDSKRDLKAMMIEKQLHKTLTKNYIKQFKKTKENTKVNENKTILIIIKQQLMMNKIK